MSLSTFRVRTSVNAILVACVLVAAVTNSVQARPPGDKAHPCTRNFPCAGERFAPVTLQAGQGARVTMANVLVPAAETTPTACPVLVRFFAADGRMIGTAQEVSLTAGAAISVSAASPSAGLVRVIVSIKGFADPQEVCAVKAAVEVFDASSGVTQAALASQECLGNGECSAPLAEAVKGER